jgi:MoxR-like ATPase
MTEIQAFGKKLINNLEKVIVGKRQPIELIVVGLLCHGHILIEDVPGVGKTVLARSLAKSLGCSFNRLQFTPDMLPSDVTGVSIYEQSKRAFEFRPGPIFAQVVLVDEDQPCHSKDSGCITGSHGGTTGDSGWKNASFTQPFYGSGHTESH